MQNQIRMIITRFQKVSLLAVPVHYGTLILLGRLIGMYKEPMVNLDGSLKVVVILQAVGL